MDEELLKIVISKHFPLFAPALSELRIKENKNLEYPAGLSYKEKTIYINPDEFSKYDSNEKLFILAHEIMHFLLVHDPNLLNNKSLLIAFNLVRDAQINHILGNMFDFIPKEAVKLSILESLSDKVRNYFNDDVDKFLKEDEYFVVKLLLSDEKFKDIISRIAEILNDNSKNDKEKSDSIERILDYNANIDASKEIADNIVKEYKELIELSEMSKEEIDKLVNKGLELFEKGRTISKIFNVEGKDIDIVLKKKRINWKKLLSSIASEIGELITDYDLTKLNKKAWIVKTYIPDVRKESDKINIVIGIDVSGSISDNEYHNFVNEVYNLLNDLNVKGKIILWDDLVRKVINMENGWNHETIKELKNRVGYSGTEIKVFFEKLDELVKDKRNTYVIILTDGYHENVDSMWVWKYKKVIFVLSENGTIESLIDIKGMKNVYITFLE